MNSLIPVIPFFIGFVLDLCLGDPPNWPHPVRWIGNTVNAVQKAVRKCCQAEAALKWGGFVLWIVVVGGTFLLVWVLLYVLNLWSFWAGFIVQAIFTYSLLATKCLKDAAMDVYRVLTSGTLEEARTQLSYIVGRDTSSLNQEQIARAVVETVAENSVDGVIAPLFYLFIGGVPLAMAYKAVNTLDSMVGYQTEKYKAIGYFSAKLDDVFNWFPARLSWILLSMASVILHLNAKAAFVIGWRDRYQHKSPNCAWSEATVAGALGIRLGGSNSYFGEQVDKPWIGDEQRAIEQADIKITIKLMYVASVFALILFTVVYCIAMVWLS